MSTKTETPIPDPQKMAGPHNPQLKVAVIGAGVAGLVAARELQREHHRVVVFEKSSKLGGLWVYDPRTESDPLSHGTVHGSLYSSLRTNLPRALMGFSDFGLTGRDYGDPREFPGHVEVAAFLKDFADRFGIVGMVRFGSEVVRVEPVEGRKEEWVVEWKKEGGVELEEEVFDAVVVCNGHFTVPRLAHIPGIEKWPGKQIHSHNYRVPEPFKDQVVIVIGYGASAYDISRDISTVAREVHISSRSPEMKFSKLNHRRNMWLHSAIRIAREDGRVEFQDGSSIQADIILHCTGYKYEFPFLKTSGIVTVDDNRVGPLYKHVFPPQLAPRLSFVDLPQKVIIFGMMELQSKWIARVLSGKVCLPSMQEMMADVEEYYGEMEALKRPKHLTHYLLDSQEYLDWIARQAGVPPIDERKWKIYKETVSFIRNQEDGFRDDLHFLSRL